MSAPASAPLSAIPLYFRGSYHLGRRRDDLAQGFAAPASDSLKGALAVAWLRLQGPDLASDAVLNFLRSFRISNAFPFHTDSDGQLHYQLPVPVGAWPPPELRHDKQLRKLTHLPFEEFAEVFLRGKGARARDRVGMGSSHSLSHSHAALQTRIQSARPWEGQKDARPFLTERRSFQEGRGLYFLLECPDAARRAEVLSALDLLGDQGIGSAKSVGGGHFTAGAPEDWACPAPAPGQARAYMSLGRFLPAPACQAGLPDGLLSYRLCSGGGFSAGASGGLHRKLRREVWLFGEGSLFTEDPSAWGDQIDLAPAHAPHPIYRDGACLFLPILRPDFIDPNSLPA